MGGSPPTTMAAARKHAKGKNMAGVYVFLGLLTLLFAANVVIRLPLDKPIDLAREGANGLQVQRGRWYVLQEGSYTIGPNIGSISLSSSFIPFYTSECTYYCVTVALENGDAFSMPVRVKGDKSKKLENGVAVKLYGMASELTGDLRSQMESIALGQSPQASYMCLNDNGDTPAKRCVASAAFAAAAAACIFCIIKIARKH